MEVAELGNTDWSTPWLLPFSEAERAISWAGDWRSELIDAAQRLGICNHGGQRIVFAPSDAAGNEPYETYIARTGEVPTRDSLHDVFNALVWLRFPVLKARLNALQATAIARDGVGATRGPLRDALTLIDENAVLLITLRSDILDWLRDHDWNALFVKQRADWLAEVKVIVFGHALLEKLTQPYKAITAHALHVKLPCMAPIGAVDQCAADAIDENSLPSDLMPLPVLGVPGWCNQNSNPDFYADRAIFRPVNIRRENQRREMFQ